MSRPRSTTSPVDELGAVLADLKARMTRVEQQSHLHPASGPGGLVPVGTVFAFGGAAAPTGYLLASGGTQLIATYPDLWGVFGTTYGGNGTTTFGIPDLRGRVIAGVDNMGGTAANRLTGTTMSPNGNTRGATGGTQTHTLTGPESGIQQHNHVIPYAVAAGGGGGFTTGPLVGNANVQNTGPTNATSAHLNTQPTLLLNYIIKT